MIQKDYSREYYIEEASASDYLPVSRLIAEEHRLHVQSRPNIFQPCGTLLSKEEFNDMLQDEFRYLYLARNKDGKVVGLCFANLTEPDSPLLTKKKVLYIEDFIVSETHRRRGIGKMLYTKIKAAAATTGAANVELTVWNFNEAALSFYRSLGMSVQFTCMEEKICCDSGPALPQ